MRKIRSDKGKQRIKVRVDKGKIRKPKTQPMRVPVKFFDRVKEFINNLLKSETN